MNEQWSIVQDLVQIASTSLHLSGREHYLDGFWNGRPAEGIINLKKGASSGMFCYSREVSSIVSNLYLLG